MNSNNMDAATHQALVQSQLLASNAGQQAITNETQGRVAMEGMERVAGLSAAQQAQELAMDGVKHGIYAKHGNNSVVGNLFSNNQKASDISKSVAQQFRLKGLA